MTTAAAPEKLRLYNLPQRVPGGIKIYGATLVGEEKYDDPVLLFDRMDGMYANLQIEGTDKYVQLSGSTPLVYEDGKYSIDKEAEDVPSED